MTACAGCDTPIPPSRGGRPRKWCSDSCRKRTLYWSRCIDCGAPCNLHGRVTDPAIRCVRCANAQPARRQATSERFRGRLHWTDDQMLDALRSVAQEGKISSTAYNEAVAAAPGTLPTAKAIIHRFGRWNAAARAAGLVTTSRDHKQRSDKTPESVMVEAIRSCASALGRDNPSVTAYSRWARDTGHVSDTTIRNHFGDWPTALERAS